MYSTLGVFVLVLVVLCPVQSTRDDQCKCSANIVPFAWTLKQECATGSVSNPRLEKAHKDTGLQNHLDDLRTKIDEFEKIRHPLINFAMLDFIGPEPTANATSQDSHGWVFPSTLSQAEESIDRLFEPAVTYLGGLLLSYLPSTFSGMLLLSVTASSFLWAIGLVTETVEPE